MAEWQRSAPKTSAPSPSPDEEWPTKKAASLRRIGCGSGGNGGGGSYGYGVPPGGRTCDQDRGNGISILPGGTRIKDNLVEIVRK